MITFCLLVCTFCAKCLPLIQLEMHLFFVKVTFCNKGDNPTVIYWKAG